MAVSRNEDRMIVALRVFGRSQRQAPIDQADIDLLRTWARTTEADPEALAYVVIQNEVRRVRQQRTRVN